VTEHRSCPLCGGETEGAFTVGDRNRAITARRFHYLRCRSCRTLFLADVPDDLGIYYPDDYYRLPSLAQLDQAAAAERPKLDMLSVHAPAGSLVDIGAAYGVFARAAQQAGYEVTAIEMDARCCEYLREVAGVRAIRSETPQEALADLPPVRVITLWHVMEHLPRPWDVLERAAGRLEQGGVLAIAMPNPDSLQLRLLGARWAHVDAPRHLFLIPFETLRARAQELGLSVALVTTADPAGRYWNAFGWEYAIRRWPARHPSTRLTRNVARLLATCLAPLERRGMNGTAYTAVFVRR
jgi:2-polyprenyl-3-methyl-5-hydroxy-6-metoxy-1,4-benzoquinol methylase